MIEGRDFKNIKHNLMQRHLNGGLPDIRLTESNYRDNGSLFLQHFHDGRPLYEPHIKDVLYSLSAIWGKPVHLATLDSNQEELVFTHYGRHDALFSVKNRQQHLESIQSFDFKLTRFIPA